MKGSSPFIEAWETSPENAFHYKPRKMHLHAFWEKSWSQLLILGGCCTSITRNNIYLKNTDQACQ